jgi:hypothetical protein
MNHPTTLVYAVEKKFKIETKIIFKFKMLQKFFKLKVYLAV